MRFTVISVVAALLGAFRWRPRRSTSDDPVGDAFRFRQELRRQPTWSDQKMELRKVNGFEGFWF
jgi:hypothetical protein